MLSKRYTPNLLRFSNFIPHFCLRFQYYQSKDHASDGASSTFNLANKLETHSFHRNGCATIPPHGQSYRKRVPPVAVLTSL